MMDAEIVKQLLCCPQCRGPLSYDTAQQTLLCQAESYTYKIQDGIPVLLRTQAVENKEDSLDGDRTV